MPDREDYRKYLELQFQGLHTAINTHAHDTHDRLDNIQKQTEKTNGRVTELEEQTTAIRWCTRNPKLSIAILLVSVIGIITLCSTIGVEYIISLIR